MPLAAVLFGVLVMALAGLVVGFALSAAHADRQFARASLSEQQAAAVARIVALAENLGPESGAREPGAPEPGSPDQAGLEDALRSYRGLIAQEAQSIGTDAEQLREAGDAALLERLAHARWQDGASRALPDPCPRDRPARGRRKCARCARRWHWRAGAVSFWRSCWRGWRWPVRGWAAGCCGVRTGRLVRWWRRAPRIAAVDASRRLFFAKASHELRTPVAGLRSAAEVALEAAGDDTTMLREALHQAVAGPRSSRTGSMNCSGSPGPMKGNSCSRRRGSTLHSVWERLWPRRRPMPGLSRWNWRWCCLMMPHRACR
jgi:hypothetical protein